jgi:predicted regulator of Ras-like GTPase activity (Roadblock/LC7/MglB family)
MKLPAGTDGGTITNPRDEKILNDLAAFRGALEIRMSSGNGFILMADGRLQAALFRTAAGSYKGQSALSFMTIESGDDGADRTFHLRTYSETDFARALEICRTSQLLIDGDETEPPSGAASPGTTAGDSADETPGSPEYLDESKLKKILSQPGVIAVSAFFEGFPVQSMGDADFEQVAASAEDFMRSGVRIAEELQAGPLEQMILETAENKFIIAPCGDLFLCVFTTPDAQLGLIRVVLRSIQSEVCR